jgi:hypothetical protein
MKMEEVNIIRLMDIQDKPKLFSTFFVEFIGRATITNV